MRTAIFLGLIYIAKAICLEVVTDKADSLAIILIVFMIMDVVEFMKKMFE